MPRREEDFPESVRHAVAARVALVCSNPECNAATSAPHTDAGKVNSVGEAAHIEGAKPGSARYNAKLTLDEIKAADNAIWLCSSCARKIDRDEAAFPVSMVRLWKRLAEKSATDNHGKPKRADDRQATLDLAYQNALAAAQHPDAFQGGIKNILDAYLELTPDEKAEIYERVFKQRLNREATYNPYMVNCGTCQKKTRLADLEWKTVRLGFGWSEGPPKEKTLRVCPACASPAQWPDREREIQNELFKEARAEAQRNNNRYYE